MKNLRIIFTASMLLLSCNIAYSQKPCLDSIFVQIDNNIHLSLAIYEYSDLSVHIEKDIKSLNSILKDRNNISEKEFYTIIYEPDILLSIKQTGPVEKIIWENGKHSSFQFNNQCNICSDNYRLKIQFNELEMLVSDSLIIKIKEVIDATCSIKGRFSRTFNYSFQGEKMVHNQQFDKINGQKDALSLKGGVGVNFVKNQPVIDLSAELGFILAKKGIWKNQYYLSYNQLSDFKDNSKVNLNGFVNLGYRYNLSNTVKNPNWLGIEIGYLALRQGDIFEENTFRLGFNWEIGKYISISPQLYLSGNSSYPAVRIGFGL
jgi:hypothetical protein